MAIKEWTTDYPTTIDDTVNDMPPFTYRYDAHRASHPNTIASALIELESAVGEGDDTTDSTENTLIWLVDQIENDIWAGHGEDKPPDSANAKDDEFPGSSLDVKWTWAGAGAPSGGGESTSVGDGRLYVAYDPDTAGAFNTDAHYIYQAPPSGDYEARCKLRNLICSRNLGSSYYICKGAGLVLANSADATDYYYLTIGYPLNHLAVHWELVTNGVSVATGEITYTDVMACLKIGDVSGTLTAYASIDGSAWVDLGNCSPAWTPDRLGLVWWSNNSTAGPTRYSSVEWFRVTE